MFVVSLAIEGWDIIRAEEEIAAYRLGSPSFIDSGNAYAHSSASRLTAALLGLLIFSQCGDRPDTYGDPRRFDTIPSNPSLHAC
jgi:hypothetical protein